MPAKVKTNKQSSTVIFIATILMCFVLSYWPVMQKLGIRWEFEDNSYCYLILPLFIYLCWEMRGLFRFSEFSWNMWGLFPAFIAVIVMIAGELGSIETLVYAGIWGCMVSILYIIYGARIRMLIFPILILAFIVPLPPFLNRLMTFHLKLAASTLSVFFMRLSGIAVLQNGNIIDLGITQLQVVDACSGLRYFLPLVLMALLFGYFYGQRLWQKVLLLALVLPLSVVVNGFRIFTSGMLHIWGYPELAEDFFHDFSGWLVFMMAGAVLFAASLLLRRMGPQKKPSLHKDPGGVATANKLQVALTTMLCLLFVGGGWALQKLPAARNLPTRSVFEFFPMEIGKWSAERNHLTDEIMNALWADDYVSATYHRPGVPNAIQLLIPFYEYQGTRHTAHAPQSCMLGSGWDLVMGEDRSFAVANGEHIKMRTTLWKKGDYRLCGAYFFLMRGRVITSPWANKAYLMLDAFTKQRTDGALVRMETAIAPGQSFGDAYAVLEEFTAELWPILSEYVPQ